MEIKAMGNELFDDNSDEEWSDASDDDVVLVCGRLLK